MNQPIVEMFLEMLNTIKLYHWKTTSYSQHKATDELHENLSKHTDKFVEVMIGKLPTDVDRNRVTYNGNSIPIYDFKDKGTFIQKLNQYIVILQDFSNRFDTKTDSDLLNIRDEMMSDINQTLYLFSLQ